MRNIERGACESSEGVRDVSSRRPAPGPIKCLSVLLLLSIVTFAGASFATEGNSSGQAALAKSSVDLKKGKPGEVIRDLESLADAGVSHPDLSFNRALAYQMRAGGPGARSGDWGQAALGFAEALSARPDDAHAARGLEEVQLSVSKKNARQDGGSVELPLGLMERALLALNSSYLFVLGALGSLLALVGTVLRLARSEFRKVAGSIAMGIGALLLVPSFGLAQARAALFSRAEMGVVVAERAHRVDEAGRIRRGLEPLVESTLVYVEPVEGGLLRLVGFSDRGSLRRAQVRLSSEPIR